MLVPTLVNIINENMSKLANVGLLLLDFSHIKAFLLAVGSFDIYHTVAHKYTCWNDKCNERSL